MPQESLVVCDKPGCDFKIPYREEEAKFTYLYINVSCPKCGENLLTEKDYYTHQNLMRAIAWLNKYFSWTMYLIPKSRWNKNRKEVSVHVHNGIKFEKPTDK